MAVSFPPCSRQRWSWRIIHVVSLATLCTSVAAQASSVVVAPGVNSRAFGPQNDRQQRIVEAFLHGWNAYKGRCWGKDELLPVSKKCSNEFGGLGAQIIDVLDTLLLMGLHKEYEEARTWVVVNFTASVNASVSVFETTIRILGGLLSGHFLTQDSELLEAAKDLGHRLLRSWREGPIPFEQVNLVTGEVKSSDDDLGSTLAEAGSLQVEFTYLSHATQVPAFMYRGESAMELLGSLLEGAGGLLPIMLDPNPPMSWTNGRVTLGGRGDSFYEYLLKRWIQTNRTEDRYLQQYRIAVDGIRRSLVGKSPRSNITFVREVDSYDEIADFLLDETLQWEPQEDLQSVSAGQLMFFVTMTEEAIEEQRDEACEEARLAEAAKSAGSCLADAPDFIVQAEETEREEEDPPEELQACGFAGADDDSDEGEDPSTSQKRLEKMVKLFSKKVGKEDQMAMVVVPSLQGEEACAVAEMIAQKQWDSFFGRLQIGLPPCVTVGGALLDTIGSVVNKHLAKQCSRFGSYKMDHLACFLPGVLALGVWAGAATDPIADLQLADGLGHSCAAMWRKSPSGLAPDSTLFGVAASVPVATVYDEAAYSCLRPETVESLWYLYMVTGNREYQELGWKIFKAIELHARLDSGGYSGIDDVRKVQKLRRRDRMETFVLSETFKYLFLLFAEEPILDLDQVVLNTEGHILPVFDPRRS